MRVSRLHYHVTWLSCRLFSAALFHERRLSTTVKSFWDVSMHISHPRSTQSAQTRRPRFDVRFDLTSLLDSAITCSHRRWRHCQRWRQRSQPLGGELSPCSENPALLILTCDASLMLAPSAIVSYSVLDRLRLLDSRGNIQNNIIATRSATFSYFSVCTLFLMIFFLNCYLYKRIRAITSCFSRYQFGNRTSVKVYVKEIRVEVIDKIWYFSSRYIWHFFHIIPRVCLRRDTCREVFLRTTISVSRFISRLASLFVTCYAWVFVWLVTLELTYCWCINH